VRGVKKSAIAGTRNFPVLYGQKEDRQILFTDVLGKPMGWLAKHDHS